MKKEHNLLIGSISTSFTKYVATSTAGMIMVSMYILFDTIFIGQSMGHEGLAALNISIPIYNLLFGTGILIGTGSATVISISRGGNKMKDAIRAYEHSFLLGFLIGLAFSIIGSIYLNSIIKFLGSSSNNIGMVNEYLGIIIPFSWSFIMVYNLSAIVRNDNGPRRAMLAMGLGGITNVIFDYILIFPLNMGMKGAAIATVMSSLVSLGTLSWHFLGKHSSYKLKSIKLDRVLSLRIFRIGFPSFIIEVSTGVIIFLFNKELIGILGDLGVSAYSIIANIALMTTSIFTGISQGMQPILSINYGAGKFSRLLKVRRYGIVLSMFIGFITLLLGLLVPEFLISIFTSETGEIVNITKVGIKLYFFAFPIAGVNIIMTSFFQSIEQTKLSTTISLMRGLILSFLCLKVLRTIFGAVGIWVTMPVAEGLTLCLTLLLLYSMDGQFFSLNKIVEV